MQEIVRYTYRLRPGGQAEAVLMAEWHRCRFLWNEAVHLDRTGRKPTLCKLSKMLTEFRARSEWMRAGSCGAQGQLLYTYSKALQVSYKPGARRRPVMKSRKRSLPSLEYKDNAFSLRGGRLNLAKCPPIPVVWSRELPSVPKTVRVFRDSLGHWYASFVVRREVEPLPAAAGSIGIDWGVKTTAATTDPAYDLPFGGHRKRCAAEMARAQRRTARRARPGQRASRGYVEAHRAVVRLHKKAARQNAHESRAWAQRVVANHGLIAVEDFKPTFLAKTRMARKAADAAIGAAKRELIERGRRAGREVVLVSPAYTTMTCSCCFARTKQRLELSQRTFRCESCGYIADRDLNAARTILATAERNRAGADDVSHHATPSGVGAVLSEPGRSLATV